MDKIAKNQVIDKQKSLTWDLGSWSVGFTDKRVDDLHNVDCGLRHKVLTGYDFP